MSIGNAICILYTMHVILSTFEHDSCTSVSKYHNNMLYFNGCALAVYLYVRCTSIPADDLSIVTVTVNSPPLFPPHLGAGINAKCLTCLKETDVEAVAVELSIGGRAIFGDICKEVTKNVCAIYFRVSVLYNYTNCILRLENGHYLCKCCC